MQKHFASSDPSVHEAEADRTSEGNARSHYSRNYLSSIQGRGVHMINHSEGIRCGIIAGSAGNNKNRSGDGRRAGPDMTEVDTS